MTQVLNDCGRIAPISGLCSARASEVTARAVAAFRVVADLRLAAFPATDRPIAILRTTDRPTTNRPTTDLPVQALVVASVLIAGPAIAYLSVALETGSAARLAAAGLTATGLIATGLTAAGLTAAGLMVTRSGVDFLGGATRVSGTSHCGCLDISISRRRCSALARGGIVRR
ncbi:hypothetical protein J5X84_10550 [Streptosporangiaceae bacterium NEAU-GS5]|nr:hypothetical protein [Streptosporangiaceae bacterium NEAU-GS5]